MNAAATELRGLALLDAAIAQIEAHPAAWKQDVYRCETGMCVAGWAAELAGGQWLTAPGEDGADELWPEPGDDPAEVFNGGVDAAYRAMRLLGITTLQANELFAGDNTLEDIRRMRVLFAAEGLA